MPRGYATSEAVKEEIWQLRAQGLSEREIARRLGCAPPTVSSYLRALGGIRPRARRRPERCLTLEEREEISRGIAGGQSARQIARALNRSHTTIAREIGRCGGRRHYRAHAADREAWPAGTAAAADEARALPRAARTDRSRSCSTSRCS